MRLAALGPGPMSIAEMADEDNLLLWVERGSADVWVGPTTYPLRDGQALWIPAGTRHRVEAAPDALCFPIVVPPRQVVARRGQPYLVAVPPGWRSWLIHQFTVAISPLRTVDRVDAGLADLLRAGADGAPADVVLPLPRTQMRTPVTPALRAVSEHLWRDPAADATVAEWAERARMSPRTLQRWFLAEVGVTFQEWRTACRLQASTEYLVAGYPVGWVAHRVGLQSLSGYVRAFTREFGLTPRSYGALARGRSSPADLSSVRGIPASSTPRLVNNFHVVIWMHTGSGRARVGQQVFDLGPGDAIWLPAGVPNQVDIAADSIMVPIQSAPPPTPLAPADVRVLALPREDPVRLLRAAVAQYTWLRPPGYDELAGWHAFERAVASPRDETPTEPAADNAALDTARRLLAEGVRPRSVADRVGYAHLSSFSRAFSRRYGASPRVFQRRHSSARTEART